MATDGTTIEFTSNYPLDESAGAGKVLTVDGELIGFDRVEVWRNPDGTVGGYFYGVKRAGKLIAEEMRIVDARKRPQSILQHLAEWINKHGI